MNVTKQMWAWLASAREDSVLPASFPSGRAVSDRTIRRLHFHASYIHERAYGSKRWCEITDKGRMALIDQGEKR